MEKMTKQDYVKLAKGVREKIQDRWHELAKDFYLCYSVKELAYKVAYDLLEEYSDKPIDYLGIDYKFWNGKHKIIFQIEENVLFCFDIWWTKSMYGDTGLLIGNGTFRYVEPKGYQDIEIAIPEEEEE
jgi:hypothetical protein